MPKDDFGRSFDLRALSAKLFKTGGLLFYVFSVYLYTFCYLHAFQVDGYLLFVIDFNVYPSLLSVLFTLYVQWNILF